MLNVDELVSQKAGLLPGREALGVLRFNCGTAPSCVPQHHGGGDPRHEGWGGDRHEGGDHRHDGGD
ncbi:hypothetical protein, partial [Streptacidiphilus anmyonensis]|uniref:hypothetical protein n=1 Tax=Streptacidiphilus anmyonensis TaxID=405782 RepID=UPI0005AA3A30